MQTRKLNFLKGIIAVLLLFITVYSFAADTTSESSESEDPCDGPAAVIAMSDRPSVANSACVVPFGKIVLETGYQYLALREPGDAQNFPEANVRIGLPGNNEFVTLPPNYIRANVFPFSGVTATTVGIKHEFPYTKKWLFAAESLFVLPSGSFAFGSPKLGAAVNGIIDYSFTPSLDLTGMFGVSSITFPESFGGRRVNSFNPDLVLAWRPITKLQFYGEVYGQTKAAPDKGAGFNMDVGLAYLVTPNLAVDTSVGQRLIGELGGFEHYIAFGAVLLFPNLLT